MDTKNHLRMMQIPAGTFQKVHSMGYLAIKKLGTETGSPKPNGE
ncbi:MAG: hypothetical protein ACOYN8_04315 [Pseudanabaena sp.]